jgi:signal transduction histidine kinase
MGVLVESFDWSATPLGPLDRWPQSLRSVVRILLTSRFAMWMGWGPELTFLYNDAYARMTLGKKHPWALGRRSEEVWAEIWRDIGPRIASVLATGTATWDEQLLLFLERSGFAEETYHTFSYSPLADDDGRVVGHLCVVVEETQRVIGERRLATLRELAAGLTEMIAEDDVLGAATRVLAANDRDLPFTLVYLFDEGGTTATLVASTGLDAGHGMAAGRVSIHDAAAVWPVAPIFDHHDSRVVVPLAGRFADLPTGGWNQPPRHAYLAPIAQPGQERATGFLVVGLNPFRPLEDSYSGFIGLLAGQLASALANARAYEAERRRAEALAELDRAKTTFFSNVSHEFRTPLTLLLGPLEDALRMRAELPAAATEALGIAQRNAFRLLKLVNSLLDFSRIEAGRVEAIYEPTDLAALTSELASTFRSAVERAGLRLDVRSSDLAEPVHIDREMWEKIVLNLLSNAFKHTFEGGITVDLRARNGAAELRVSDSGIGVPADQLPRLFDRFHRVPNARSRTHEGSGIGLALVQELVRLHFGEITVESVEGVGTTFTVRVPLGTAHLPRERAGSKATDRSGALGAAPFVEEAARWLEISDGNGAAEPTMTSTLARGEAPDTSSTRGARVLLADDNADMREYVARLLRTQGWVVDAVADGAAALEAARATPPDLVLSDVMMPHLDGFELLRALRGMPATTGVPVILLSARAGEESRVEGLEAGADDYLVKPFSARELLARVNAHLTLSLLRSHATAEVEAAHAELTVAHYHLREQMGRTRQLQSLTASLAGVRTVEEVATVAVDQIKEATGAISGMFALREADTVRIVRQSGLNEAIAAAYSAFPLASQTTAAAAIRTGESVFSSLGGDDGFDARYADAAGTLTALGARSIASVPLVVGGEAVGAMSYTYPGDRTLTEEDGEFLGTLAVQASQALERARALSAEREARAAAEEANAAKMSFLAAMSHELRTPLNAIAGYAQLIELGVHGPVTEAQHEALGRILRSEQHLLSLINDVLNFAKLEAGHVEYAIADVVLDEAVAAVATMVEPQLRERSLNYSADVPGGIVVRADREKLQQILINLLSNAIKFTEPGGSITVDLGRREGAARGAAFLRVTDTGIGIPREKQDSVFDPFVQVHRNLTTNTTGTGLGLAISRDLARGMGGELRVRSMPGKGSTFTLSLVRARRRS